MTVDEALKAERLSIAPTQEKCTQVTSFEPWKVIGHKMFEALALLNYNRGIVPFEGLAAPEVGLPYRAFVLCVDGPAMLYINPEILEESNDTWRRIEACASMPKVVASLQRPTKIKVAWQSVDGKEHRQQLTGSHAGAFIHHFQHLIGVSMTGKG